MMALRSSPLCADCSAQGLTTPATEVHHVTKKRDGGEDSEDNLLTLCKPCHSKRTARGE